MSLPSYHPLGDLSSKKVFFRLQVKDFNFALFCFFVAHWILKRMGLTPFALAVPVLILIPLAFIRTRCRNHTIRDVLESIYSKGKLYVSVYTRT